MRACSRTVLWSPRAELTSTVRAAIHRYTFPAGAPARVVLDLEHRDRLTDSSVVLSGDAEVTGFRRSTGWARDQVVYFVLRFSRPFTSRDTGPATTLRVFEFGSDAGELLVKVGISAVSVEGARKNLNTEISGWNFAGQNLSNAEFFGSTLTGANLTGAQVRGANFGPGSGGTGTNLAVGKAITASSSTFTFVATNANDDNVTTYWEGAAGYPQTLTVALGSNAVVSSVVIKLNPDAAWGTRTQTIQVLGREQSASGYSNLVSAATYTFNPSSGANTVTIPV